MNDPLLELAQALGGDPVELKETHISRVALAGPPGAGVVLKQCKPVDFGFVDLRTREQRRAALEKEAAVNDRFAPGVYRGVRDLPDGEPVLEMLRLNEADTLEAKVKRGAATSADLDAVLDHLLPLFEVSDRGPEVAKWGAPAVIRQNVVENLEALDATAARLDKDLRADVLRGSQLIALSLLRPELERRAAGGWVQDGHGDLRAEHVYLAPEGVKTLDGIAFGDRLRCVDVADEIAFLAYSLDAAGWPDGAETLIRRYRARSGDPVGEPLLALYRSYRAAVRAKVAALALPPVPPSDAWLGLREQVERAFEPLEGRVPDHPILIAVGGLSGSGKSTLAAAVAAKLGVPHLRSDALRKAAFGLAPGEAAPPEAYASEVSATVYAELGKNWLFDATSLGGAVADATFLTRDRRAELIGWSQKLRPSRPPFLFVWCEVDDAVAERRIERRAAEGEDASDADAEVRRRQTAQAEPPTDTEFAALPNVALLRLDTDGPVETLVERVIDALRDRVRVAGPGGVP